MNKYVVAFMSLYDNDLLMEVIEAESKLDAAKKYLASTDWDSMVKDYAKLSTLQNDLFDGDCVLNVIQIDSDKKYLLDTAHNPVRDIYIQ